MNYYVNEYKVLFDKNNMNIELKLLKTDTDYVITEVEGDNSYSPLQVVADLLEIMEKEKIIHITCLDDIKNITDTEAYYIFTEYGKDFSTIYHIINIVKKWDNSTYIVETVMEI